MSDLYCLFFNKKDELQIFQTLRTGFGIFAEQSINFGRITVGMTDTAKAARPERSTAPEGRTASA
ncbi:hypothetical protein [Nocardia stercoris]|uniref:hypothetical protein n=1 Tax=Nocardia stercoris TaxID=2483361 RepID=UPI0011C396A8|nr:hypothetical protein [Nocardia stercoris]